MLLDDPLRQVKRAIGQSLVGGRPGLVAREVGTVQSVGTGVARVSGLAHVGAQELVTFANGTLGVALDLQPEFVGVALLGTQDGLEAGTEVQRTGRVADIPVGDSLLGRSVDGTGAPLDGLGPIATTQHWPIERPAPPILDRAPVSTPLHTGIKVIDALIPIGRGQRQLIIGDRQTGKTAIALDTIINQRASNMVCVYCAIGQRGASVAKAIDTLRAHQALSHSVVVVARGEVAPGLRVITPYAATTIAEYFLAAGKDVLIVFDDLTRHAQAYRELSLLLRRPPGREAYPGDIFYIHSRLLERATCLSAVRGGGSLTALPIVQTEANNISAYIPTNLISITDGQVYLSNQLFQRGQLPAVDVGASVSRVGGKAQLRAFDAVAGPLRLAYAQFSELEIFTRFGSRLDEATHRAIDRGQRVRESLRQPEHSPRSTPEQVAVLLAVNEGVLDSVPIDRIGQAERTICQSLSDEFKAVVLASKPLSASLRTQVIDAMRAALGDLSE